MNTPPVDPSSAEEPAPPPVNAAPSSELSRRAVRGALWTGISQYALFALGIVKVGILARLVPQEFFGAVTLAIAWSSYLLFFKFDFRAALISWPLDDDLLDTHFWLDVGMTASGFVIAGLVYLFAPTIVSPLTWTAIFILLGLALVDSLTLNARLMTERDLRQDLMAQLTLIASVLTLVIPVGLALAGQYLLAVVLDVMLPALVLAIGLAVRVRWRPRWVFNRGLARKLLDFGLTMWTTGLLGKIVFQFDDWLVGTLNRPNPTVWLGAGETPLAYYGRAYTAGKMPMDVFAGFIGSIALPLYARSEGEGRAVLRTTYQQTTWLLTYLIFFSSTVALVATREVVLILLGPNWLPTVPLFQLMSLFILGRPFYQNASQLLLAVGQEKQMRLTVLVQAVFLLVLGPPAVWFYGAGGAAVVISLMTIVGMVPAEWYVQKLLGAPLWRIYLLPGLTSLLLVVTLNPAAGLFPDNIFISGTLKGLICTAAFVLTLLIFERRQAMQAVALVRQHLRR